MTAAPTRKKLPAYGARLLKARRSGKHPLTVHVVFGHDWRSVNDPKICINPDEFLPGVFDWRCIAGVRALVMDQACESLAEDGRVFGLIGELADYAAFVDVDLPDGEQMASAMAFARRIVKGGRRDWPLWWNDEREARMEAGFCAWMNDVAVCHNLPTVEHAHAG